MPRLVEREATSFSNPRISPFWLEHEIDDDEWQESVITDAHKLLRSQRAREWLAWRQAQNGGTETMTSVTSINLDGDDREIQPEIALRMDDVPLLYRGRVNTVFGRSETGKSWFTLGCAQSVVRTGGRVVVVDLEDDVNGFRHRLRTLGFTTGQAALVSYHRPWALGESERATILATARSADLLIVDSMDAMTALMGQSDGALAIRTVGAVLKQWATVGDCAVLLVDHTSEKTAEPSNTAMGSSAKKQFIDGVTYRTDRLTSWAPGQECRTMLMVGKDRHGWAKANALFEKPDETWGRMALMRLQPCWPDGDGSELDLLVPPDFTVEPSTSSDSLRQIEDDILTFLRQETRVGQWQPQTAVLKAGGDKNGRRGQAAALDRLIKANAIEMREIDIRGGRTGTDYRYVDLEDPLESP